MKIAFWAVIALMASYVSWRLLGNPDESAITVVTDITFPVLGGLATALALAAAQHATPDDRPSWRLMTGALLAYLLADAAWAAIELSTGEPPDLSVADVGYLLFYPLALAALLRLPGPARSRLQQAQMVLDGLILVVLGAVIQWIVVIGPALDDTALDPLATLVTIAYPIADLVLLFAVAVVALRRRFNRRNLPLVLLGAAVTANMLGDLASGSAWIVDGFTTGSTPDLLFMGFWVLAAAGAWTAIRFSSAPGVLDGAEIRDRPPAAVFWLPYAAAIIGIGLPAAMAIAGATEQILAAGVGLSVISLLVLIRQVLAATEGARNASLAARRAAEAQLGSILGQVTDLVLIVDIGGIIRFASPAATSVVGRDAAALLGMPVRTLARPEDRAALHGYVAALLEGAGGGMGLRWQLADRVPPIDLDTTGARIVTDEDGAAVVLVCRDVSERVRRELELSEARRLRAVGQLAGGIAHEFNNLLTGIGGYADLIMADEAVGTRHRGDLLEIRRATDRAAQLTRQLLAVGRRQHVRPTSVNLERTIAEYLPNIRALAGDAIDVRVEAAPDLPPAFADVQQIGQVLLDLVANAHDAMPSGGDLTIALHRVPRDAPRPASVAPVEGGWVALDVTDTGSGMDPVTVTHLFEPFFTTKGVGQGTGLGLASAQGIVSEAGGWIDVTTTPGAGSRFRVCWPVATGVPTGQHHGP